MSTSGGTGGNIRPAAGRLFILGGESQLGAGAASAGAVRLYPVRVPIAVPYTALGVNVTAAGAAGATLQPVFYGLTANGDPGAPIITGPVLAADAIAQVNGAQAGTIPAGYLWAGTLCLSPGAVPSCTITSHSDQDPRGALVPTDNAVSGSVFPFQSGLAALPNPFAGTYIAGSAPVLFVTT